MQPEVDCVCSAVCAHMHADAEQIRMYCAQLLAAMQEPSLPMLLKRVSDKDKDKFVGSWFAAHYSQI